MGTRRMRLYYVNARQLLLIMGIVAATIVLFQLFKLPSTSYIFSLTPAGKISILMMVKNSTLKGNSESAGSYVGSVVGSDTYSFDSEEESEYLDETQEEEVASDLVSYDGLVSDEVFDINVDGRLGNFTFGKNVTLKNNLIEEVRNRASFASLLPRSAEVSASGMGIGADSKTSGPYALANVSMRSNSEQETQLNDKPNELLKSVLLTWSNNSAISKSSMVKRRRKRPISISQMNSLLLQGGVLSSSMRGQRLSKCDRELLSAKLHIMDAPIVRSAPGLQASIFRNISMFKRSYDLMERILKVYIYKEGERPIFHQPKLGGIYASEGWFMKLMEGNKHFVARDPRKAHLFYIAFSSKILRDEFEQSPPSFKETYLRDYLYLISQKYRFWNRTEGADHFLVACHDWAPKITSWLMRNCIRALCNANVAQGFKIGKDTTLPVTTFRKAVDPLKDLGWRRRPPSQRPVLAFFAGSMHGYLRPILLRHWENKDPYMKIMGPMPRDGKGTENYRENMRSSKYCICARGYEVHTPRVVEAILAECVPVIISDNYVPPFFEVLNWDTFSVFILEEDVPNLRNILLSISEEKYLQMQLRVQIVQQHFLWHKKPKKYDLFHMILHSIWYNRVFKVKNPMRI